MTVYSSTGINDRLLGTVAAVSAGGSNGNLKILAGGATVCTIALQNPCGTVANNILTFTGTLLDPSATGSLSPVDSAVIVDSNGATVISGLTAGVSRPGNPDPDIVISSSRITAGQCVQLLSAQITGAP
jgi:hypothetical protein